MLGEELASTKSRQPNHCVNVYGLAARITHGTLDHHGNGNGLARMERNNKAVVKAGALNEFET